MKKCSALLLSVVVSGALVLAPVTGAEAAKPRVSIKVSSTKPVAGSIVTFKGKVRGDSAGKRITLQKKVGKRWKKVDAARVSTSRAYSLKVRVKAGRHLYRAKVAGKGRFKTAVSRTVSLRARKLCVRYRPSKMSPSVTNPRGMATDLRNGSYYVADSHRVRKYAADGTLRYTIGGTTSGSDNRSFNSPTDVEVDKHGNLYVTDMHNYRVQKFSSSGRYLMSFGTPGVRFSGGYPADDPASVPTWRTRFFYAADTEVRDDGLVYVLDNYHVKIFNPDGSYRAYLDLDYVSSPEDDDSTAQMELDALGDLYVAYANNPVVVRFNSSFRRAAVIRLQHRTADDWTEGLALTRHGTLMVSRKLDSKPFVQEYSRSGKRLRNLPVLQDTLGSLARGRGDVLYSVSFYDNSLVRYSTTKRRC